MELDIKSPILTNPPNILNGLEIPKNTSKCLKFLSGIIKVAVPAESCRPNLLNRGILLSIFPSKL